MSKISDTANLIVVIILNILNIQLAYLNSRNICLNDVVNFPHLLETSAYDDDDANLMIPHFYRHQGQ